MNKTFKTPAKKYAPYIYGGAIITFLLLFIANIKIAYGEDIANEEDYERDYDKREYDNERNYYWDISHDFGEQEETDEEELQDDFGVKDPEDHDLVILPDYVPENIAQPTVNEDNITQEESQIIREESKEGIQNEIKDEEKVNSVISSKKDAPNGGNEMTQNKDNEITKDINNSKNRQDPAFQMPNQEDTNKEDNTKTDADHTYTAPGFWGRIWGWLFIKK